MTVLDATYYGNTVRAWLFDLLLIYMGIQQALNLAIYRRFEDEGIDFAYPTQTIYMQGETASTPALKAKEPPK